MKVYKANKRKKKISAVAICLLLTAVMAVGGTLAWLIDTSTTVTNTFKPAEVGNYVNETFDGTTKTNVTIKNNINNNEKDPEIVDAYIRATVAVTWQDGNGNMLLASPNDYSLVYAKDTGWISASDEFWYYTSKVAPDGETGVFISSCSSNTTVAEAMAAKGYYLHVEILSQSVQAEPYTVVGNVWPMVIASESGTLSLKS